VLSRLQKIASRLPGVVYQFLLRPDGSACFPYASEAIRDIYRVSPEEVRDDASKVFAILHPDDFDGVVTSIQKSAQDLTPWYHEYRVKFNDGTVRWLLGSALPERVADGSTLWYGFITDNTKPKQVEDTLKSKTALLEAQLNATTAGVLVIGEDGKKILISSQIIKMFNVPQHIIDDDDDATLLRHVVGLTKYPDKFLEKVMYLYDHADEISFDEIELKSGVFLDRYSAPIFGKNGEKYGRIWTFHDVTDRKHAENDLRIAATAFETQEGMLVTDVNKNILRINRAFSNITGFSAEEVIGKNPHILSSGRHDAAFYDEMWKSINDTGEWAGEIWNKRKNGEIYPEHLTITVVKNDKGNVTNYVASSTDVTISKAAAEEIQNLAFYDPLTQLPNRRLLVDRTKQALAGSARSGWEGALLFIDLDHFKTLNDTLGHDYGDLLLQQVATRLTDCVREGDTVARMGGDEFVVLLVGLSVQSAEAAAQTQAIGDKILARLNQPYQLASHEHHSTPSIGATLFNNHQMGIEELLKQADIAMYQAKAEGRNTLRFFDRQMQDVINTRASTEIDLRKAIEQQQFQLYYQIQVDSAEQPVGAEALIRWIHPERGLVPPNDFIPLAEDTGLILPIGQWVLETACAQLKVWERDKTTYDLTISINVSAKQFRQADFITQIQAALERHGINPMLLKLELTESILLESIENTIATISALKEMGIRFSLDDFGTGYSSLQYLKKLPLYQLKIDQSFVRDIAVDSGDQAIVRTIIAMASSLDLNVIAEGVETEEQRQLLQSNGCNTYQGYLFGKPLPIQLFEATLIKLRYGCVDRVVDYERLQRVRTV